MASLKEIKGRIASVRSTLKTTSAMKLVSSAKLQKTQNLIDHLLPYSTAMNEILTELVKGINVKELGFSEAADKDASVALVCFASNSTLCGSFNANIIKYAQVKVRELEKSGIKPIVYSVGRRMEEAMKKIGYESPVNLTKLSGNPSYEDAVSLAEELLKGFKEGRFSRVELIYTHFINMARQEVHSTTFLPLNLRNASSSEFLAEEYIIEPSEKELLLSLLPRTLKLQLYTIALEASESEHSARTMAMQTATDNGENLLQELSLEFNKSRQQKITSEILDLVGGQID